MAGLGLRPRRDHGAEARSVELQRHQFARDCLVQPQRSFSARHGQRIRHRRICTARSRKRCFQLGNPLAPCFYRIESRAQIVGKRRKIVGRNPVFARKAAQFEQSRFVVFQLPRIVDVQLRRTRQLFLGNRSFDNRPIECRQCFGKRAVFARHPVKRARRRPQFGQRALGTFD